MVKFSNKSKGRPSKRKTLKTKYKIERKVKQHRKKLQKEAKKLKGSGLKHKRVSKSEFLPNLFPFKPQILQQIGSTLPKEMQVPVSQLNSADFGLINLQNKPTYFPKPKDNLIKKHVTNLDKLLAVCNVVLEVVDARCPQICLDADFQGSCEAKKAIRIVVVCKIDTIKQHRQNQTLTALRNKQSHVVQFTTDPKEKNECIQSLLWTIKKAASGQAIVFVGGKANTGKHTLITQLCRYAGKVQDVPCSLFQIALEPNIKMIDAPYKLEDKTGYPLFWIPNPLKEESVQAQEESLLQRLFLGDRQIRNLVMSREEVLVHYSIQDFTSVDDFVKKVGKMTRTFGKGGMIDTQKVRVKILTDWFVGKLNHLMVVQ